MAYTGLHSYRKKAPMTKKVNVNSVKSIVRKELKKKSELKMTEAVFTMSPLIGALNLQLVNGIAEGVSDFQRVGNEVRGAYLRVKGDIQFGDSVNKVRMLVILDRQPNNAIPTIGDIFTFSATPLTSFKSSDNDKRFVFLRDKTYTIGSGGPVGKSIDLYVKTPYKTLYTGSNASIADLRTNAIYIAFMTDSGAIPNPTLNACYRYAYYDN